MTIKNLAIIMDGNGRWAKQNKLPIKLGHSEGVKALKKIVKESVKQNFKSLTVFAFSSENWRRSSMEVNSLNNLILDSIENEVPDLVDQEVSLNFFGDFKAFGKKTVSKIEDAENQTNIKNPKLLLNVALGFGGRQDIVAVCKKVSAMPDSVTINQSLVSNLSEAPSDPRDLLIRTGGDLRLSNFLLYQLAYAEIHFVKKFWPDFSPADLRRSIKKFENTERRFGKR